MKANNTTRAFHVHFTIKSSYRAEFTSPTKDYVFIQSSTRLIFSSVALSSKSLRRISLKLKSVTMHLFLTIVSPLVQSTVRCSSRHFFHEMKHGNLSQNLWTSISMKSFFKLKNSLSKKKNNQSPQNKLNSLNNRMN